MIDDLCLTRDELRILVDARAQVLQDKVHDLREYAVSGKDADSWWKDHLEVLTKDVTTAMMRYVNAAYTLRARKK